MASKVVKFNFKPCENEQIEAVVKLGEEKRSVIHGIVVDSNNRPIKNAVVKLLMVKNPSGCKPTVCAITHTFTDEYGQFLFGPLCPDRCYLIKVWYNDVKIREVVVDPDPCSEYCLKCSDASPCRDKKRADECDDDC
ncbi:carboxypeptidase-like regulatory domain-containing protein [Clostridium rectalis]|uniref:carboxypeptidase-like regulatory domain-containing protein n=1 Tax=Clostridium rectalis TaxID=2040295 RepID=UPI000F636E1F|nr:carboxypeptidase-like regulatory domain-containing protein [Clostridium rectalis]